MASVLITSQIIKIGMEKKLNYSDSFILTMVIKDNKSGSKLASKGYTDTKKCESKTSIH